MEVLLPDAKLCRNDGDYEKDGILYCGKCNSPKQWRGIFLGKEVTKPCLCDCEVQRREQLKRDERIQRNKKIAFGNSPMIDWNFENDNGKNKQLSTRAKNYVENFETFKENGRGILLYGKTGTGKTFTACCIANGLLDRGYSVLVKRFADIANELFSCSDKTAYTQNLMDVSLLVLDDMGVERKSSYMNEVVFTVVDGRYRAGKPMIITTNVSAETMKNAETIEEQRIYSRLNECCIPILAKGEDMRKEKAKELYKRDMELLENGKKEKIK